MAKLDKAGKDKKKKFAGKKKKFDLFVKKTTSAGAGKSPMPMKKKMK